MFKFFIDRPIFSAVISILITVLGALALVGMPLEQYPQITPPVIQVQASFPGANATTVAESVAAPIEQQVNGAKGMLYMESRSTNDGAYRLNVTFEVGTDPDLAAVEVQNRLGIAQAQLPADVTRQGVTVRKAATGFLQIVALSSTDGRYDNVFLSNYATLYMQDALARVPGVGQTTIFGARDYSMRLWLDPDKMTRLGVTATDVQAVLAEQNAVAPAGRIGANPVPPGQEMQYSVTVRGRLAEARAFENIILRTGAGGQLVRLRDIARVELASSDYNVSTTIDGRPSVLMAIFPQPNANALEVARGVQATLDNLAPSFPPGLSYRISFDAVPFITESLKQVLITLGEAFVLVVLVVFIFLQSWRASIIPLVAVPVSLVGTFALLAAFGFSINTLTMLALVLAIGIVVDDAIVVVEAVEQKMRDERLPPREATIAAMKDVGGPVVAIALVLCAVFVPVAFLGGLTGQLYKQFALTLSVAVLLSAVVALTLTPALCALLLKPHPEGKRRGPLGWLFNGFNWGFDRFSAGYSVGIRAVIRWWLVGLVVFGVLIGYVVWLDKKMPRGLLPEEDQAFLLAVVNLPLGASNQRTTEALRSLTAVVSRHPAVERVQTINGLSTLTFVSASYQATMIIVLKNWDEREAPNLRAGAVRAQLMGMMNGAARDATVNVLNPTPIRGLGSAGGFEFVLQDRSGGPPQRFGEVLQGFLAQARQTPELGLVFTSIDGRVPQIEYEVDRDRAKLLGLRLTDVYQTLQTYLGGLYVNDLNLFGRTYRVLVQAEGNARRSPEDATRFFVRSQTGEMVPLSTVLTPRTINGPEFLQRYNLYRAATINGSAAAGYSGADAIAAMERLAAQLPPGYTYEWTGATFQEKKTAGQTGIIFALAVLFTFLLLAALYESWTLPTAILLAIPFGILGAYLAVWFRGYDNNVYTQIGLIMLVGLAAKNAILIVEYAKLARERGAEIVQAALDGAKLRLRPILMTSFAFIFGALPLAYSYGAGSGARRALGTAVVYGMTAATLIGIFFIPMFYVLMQRLSEWRFGRGPRAGRLAARPAGE